MPLGFAASVRATTQKQAKEVDSRIESMAVELFTAAVDLSPKQPSAHYSKGEFINNWVAVADGEDYSTAGFSSDNGDASRASIAAIRGKETFLAKDGFVTLSNGTIYSALVEYKGWPSSINPLWKDRVGPYAPVRNAFTQVVPTFKKP